jgi:peptidoglycan/xylan/chitin deacetylase (PgdA/CDA1 family)
MISLTVDVEEGFHGLWPSAYKTMIRYRHESLEGTFIEPLRSILNLFERNHVRSTFFVLGRIAEAFPEVVEEIYDSGHEVASHGYCHVDLTKISLTELEEMERKNCCMLAKITGEIPRGFRAPFFGINPAIISLLSKMGYVYDSSVVPSIGVPGWWSNYGASLGPHSVNVGRGEFFEVPISVFPYLRLPIGGWFLRNFGVTYAKTAIKWFLRRRMPAIIYVHPFDVDFNVQKLGGIRSYATRRCGEHTLKAIKNLLEAFDCPKVPIRDMLEKIVV